jgi:hypothetical protein
MHFLDFRTRGVGGPVLSTPLLYRDDRLLGAGLRHLPSHPGGLAFVVHGYNNSRSAGITGIRGFATAALQAVPSLAPMELVGVLWPGDAVFGFLSYPTEEADADRTADALANELEQRDFAVPPSFVAHSLGCRVVLRALDALVRRRPNRESIDQLVLFAGAVDNDVLGRRDRYAAAAAAANRVVNVASTTDKVLRYAFPVGDWLAGVFSGGYTRTALGRDGPAANPMPPKQVARFQVGHHRVDHGDYLGGDSDLRRRAAAMGASILTRREPVVF